MSPPRRRLLCVLALPLLGGCVYYNSLYNAARIYDEAERLRSGGGVTEARERYAEVAEKAFRSYQRDPGGRWADEALYLMGRAYLRQGDGARARAALTRALEVTDDEGLRAGATLYLGVAAIHTGDAWSAVTLLDRALSVLEPGRLRAEGYFWRAQALLSLGRLEAGWSDLERAEAEGPFLGVSADLERLRWGLAHGDGQRAASGASGLLSRSDGASRMDSLHALVEAARRLWGAGGAAALLRGVEQAPWPQAERDGTLLLRASLRTETGDTAAAAADAERVAAGTGSEAVRARLWLAGVELSRTEAVAELNAVRPILLPAVGSGAVLDLLEAIRMVELLEGEGEERPGTVALFAAAELARDRLGAPRLAGALFLRYAEADAASPWAGKALLAALDLAADDSRWAELLGRMEARTGDLYLQAAAGGASDEADFERLERELVRALDSILVEVTGRAERHDMLARERSTPPPPRL